MRSGAHGGYFNLAEPKTAEDLINAQAPKLQAFMQGQLRGMAKQGIQELMAKIKALPADQRAEAARVQSDLPGLEAYKAALLGQLAQVAALGLDQARVEVPVKGKIGEKIGKKLAERLADGSFQFAELTDFSPAMQAKIKAQAALIADTQSADAEKSILFELINSLASIQDDIELEAALEAAAVKYIDSTALTTGSVTITSDLINSARTDHFLDEGTVDEIESFTFTNPDPITPICQDLNGITFAVDDPNIAEYQTPLHHNCKSYWTPNLKQNAGKNPALTPGGLTPSNDQLLDYVTLAEHRCDHWA